MRSRRWGLVSVLAWLLYANAVLAAPALRVVTAEEPPTNFTRDGQLTGLVTETVQAIMAQLGQSAAIDVFPWARAYSIALNEPNTLIFTAGQTAERSELGFHFIGPVTTRRHTLYARAGQHYSVQSLDAIKRLQLRVGALRADWRLDYLRAQGLSVEDATSHAVNLRKLLAGRVDLIALSDLELGENLALAGANLDAVEPVLVFDERPAYLALSNGTDADTVMRWEQAFAALRLSDFFSQACARWSDELGMPIGFTSARGFHIKQ